MIPDPDAPFYVLGLSPNASRLNVRYWLVGTVRQFAERLAEHAERLEMTGAETRRPAACPSVDCCWRRCARRKDIAPQLAGERRPGRAWRSPATRTLLQRGRSAHPARRLTSSCAGGDSEGLLSKREARIMWSLSNKEHPDKAYHCGRLFAVLSSPKNRLWRGQRRRRSTQHGERDGDAGPHARASQRAAEIGHIPKLERRPR